MKIIKAHKNLHGHLYLMVDEIPKITYEKIGESYVGSDEEGIFNYYLKYKYGSGNFKAFAGREFPIELKDGTIVRLKDHWWDAGVYDKENEYVNVGLGTLEDLQDCYIYCSYNIKKDKLKELINDYLSRDKFYNYYEIEKWAKLQYKWYSIIFHGKEIPFMMNYKGNVVDRDTKEYKYVLHNYIKYKKNKVFKLKLFKLSYKDETGRLIKLEDNYINIVKETLPEQEFKKYLKWSKKHEINL
jgi:hypothetical protein